LEAGEEKEADVEALSHYEGDVSGAVR
jgi:hypothetical protein